MTLTQMKYFFEVCKWQSITKAASALHVSQPTVSVAILDFEKETGLNLFRREGKKLILTEDGQIIWDKITPILNNLHQLKQEIQDLAQNKNLIRLAVPLQIGVHLLPAIFTEFKALYPEIDLEIVETGGIDSLRMIERDELDLAITNYDNQFSSNLLYRKICDTEICFCTYASHAFAQKKYVTIKDVATNPLVLLNGGFFITRAINQSFQTAELSPNVILYTSQLHTVKNLVRNGIASTFLMKQAILPSDNIIAIPLKPSYFINSGIVIKKGRQVYSDEQKLIRFIRNKHMEIQN